MGFGPFLLVISARVGDGKTCRLWTSTTNVSAPRYSPGVDVGLYESLLTERLNAALLERPDLEPNFSTVDDAEQALSIARHLLPLIERQQKAVGSAEAREELVRNILEGRVDKEELQQNLRQIHRSKIYRPDVVRPAETLGRGTASTCAALLAHLSARGHASRTASCLEASDSCPPRWVTTASARDCPVPILRFTTHASVRLSACLRRLRCAAITK